MNSRYREKLNIEDRGLVSTFLCGAAIGLVWGIVLGVYLWRIYGGGVS
jgi:tetrahydromethanopterin S-methyltransferase subunit F